MPGDEFDWIAQLLRPLTRGAPEALDLLDDACAGLLESLLQESGRRP
jgi:hypothetical protein